MDSAKRAWFQIHLSTAVVLMVAVGAIMGMSLDADGKFGWPLKFLQVYGSQISIDISELMCDFILIAGNLLALTVWMEAHARWWTQKIHPRVFGLFPALLCLQVLAWANFRRDYIWNSTHDIEVGWWWGWPCRMAECGFLYYRAWNLGGIAMNAGLAAILIGLCFVFCGRKYRAAKRQNSAP